MNIISALQSQIARNKHNICLQEQDICRWKWGIRAHKENNPDVVIEYISYLSTDRKGLKKLVAIQKALKKQLALHIEFTSRGMSISYCRYFK